MNKLALIAAIGVLISIIAGCKTNEANYRAAYEKAMEKRTETGDSATTAALRAAELPKPMTIGGVTLPVLTAPVKLVDNAGGTDQSIQRYCVVVGKFKQVFNARSMRQRLADHGWNEAFVVVDRRNDNYVIAASTSQPVEAQLLFEKVKADTSMVLRDPLPYILRPSQTLR